MEKKEGLLNGRGYRSPDEELSKPHYRTSIEDGQNQGPNLGIEFHIKISKEKKMQHKRIVKKLGTLPG